jgi:hypothetical protein
MVWDTIYGREASAAPASEWGGIGYALAALEATLPNDWQIVPLIKVGSDLTKEANEFLFSLTRRAGAGRFVEVPAPNNRVTLRYDGLERTAEHLSGGVPPWTWEELGPMVQDLDILYLNFISGFEMQLETALKLRHVFPGPIYADLHSLFLGVAADGLRTPQALPNVSTWFSCFDVVQLNQDEMSLVGADPIEVAAIALAAGVGLLIVTLAEQGAVYFSVPSYTFERVDPTAGQPTGPISTVRVPAQQVTEPLDPTGCGDVFGASVVSFLAQGMDVAEAVRRGNTNAASNLSHRGATHLQRHLRGKLVVQ